MEKKKLLLVAVSVGVVLLILIGIPLLLLVPRQSSAYSGRSSAPVTNIPEYRAPIEAPDLAQGDDGIPEQQPSASDEQPVEIAAQQPAVAPQVTTITVPTPRTVAVPDTPVRSAPRPAAANPAPARPTVASPSPAPVAAPATPAAQAPIETARPQVTAARPAQTETARTYNNFWVQTGAFSTKIRAEGVKESLEEKGITSIIENSDINGKTWYQVRVGPYMSENEANYWLALVQSIDGFADSQVRRTQALR